MTSINVYWMGIVGVPGKGPNWVEPYDPNKTIGQIIQNMKNNRLGNGKDPKIEILKYQRGDLGKKNLLDPYWSHETTMAEYVTAMGHGSESFLVYVTP
jgi:hypothetical protein